MLETLMDMETSVTLHVQNPSSVQFERSMAKMSPESVTDCTWGQFCHVWKDSLSAEEHSRAMLEKAFPVRNNTKGTDLCQAVVQAPLW